MEIDKIYATLNDQGYGSGFKIINDKLFINDDYIDQLYNNYKAVRKISDSVIIYFEADINTNFKNNIISSQNYNFYNCFFETKITLNNSKDKPSKLHMPFLHSFNFEECFFNEDVEIYNKTFSSLSFLASVFNLNVLIKDVSLEKELFFYNCRLNADVKLIQNSMHGFTLSKCHVEGGFHAFRLNITSNSIIKFDGTLIKRGIDIAEMGLGNKISLFGFEVVEHLIMNQFKVKLGKLDELSKSQYAENCVYTKESFRILKSELKSQNNNIDALVFERLEKLIHRKELQFNFYFEKGIHKLPPLYDIILIWFGEISNKNGTSFVKALAFIFWIAFFATAINLYIYYLNGHLKADLSQNGITYVVKNFLSFFNLTNWSSNTLELKEYWYALLITFVFKVLMTIGIYQFIQAARKWSSK